MHLLKESKNLSTIRDVLFEEINLCQYILVHWKRNALVIYNMNIIKNVLVRVVHMLQDFNTLMQALARVVRARLSRKWGASRAPPWGSVAVDSRKLSLFYEVVLRVDAQPSLRLEVPGAIAALALTIAISLAHVRVE